MLALWKRKLKLIASHHFQETQPIYTAKGNESDALSYVLFNVTSVKNLGSGGPDSSPASDSPSRIKDLRGLELKISSVI